MCRCDSLYVAVGVCGIGGAGQIGTTLHRTCSTPTLLTHVCPYSSQSKDSSSSSSGNGKKPPAATAASSSSASSSSASTTSSSGGGGEDKKGGDGKKGQWWCPKCGDPCTNVDTCVCKYSYSKSSSKSYCKLTMLAYGHFSQNINI